LLKQQGSFYLTWMCQMECNCTVLFEDPFWIALFEVIDEEGYRAARHVFGALPNEAELHHFALNQYTCLRFSAPISTESSFQGEKVNFKRRQRQVRQSMLDTHHQKRAWAALQADLETHQQERRQTTQAEKEAAGQEAFLARQQQKKEKHRGH
jgi:hypothetical protein